MNEPAMTTQAARSEYPQREIFMFGRYINCQILNWDEGPPPKYIICHPLHPDYREDFLAMQGMGTWMKADLRDVLRDLTAALPLVGVEQTSALDLAWEKINALGGAKPSTYDDFGRGIIYAVAGALEIIEELGGSNPAKKRAFVAEKRTLGAK
jgi:hypothetical protein